MVKRAKMAVYRIDGIYLGTEDPEINIARIRSRVELRLGHEIDPVEIPGRHAYSLSNLRKNLNEFDYIEIHDNSQENDVTFDPVLVLQCVVELGKVRELDRLPSDEMASWCASMFERIERDARMRAERTSLAEKKK